MTDPQKSLSRAILLVFFILLAVDLIPRIISPQKPVEVPGSEGAKTESSNTDTTAQAQAGHQAQAPRGDETLKHNEPRGGDHVGERDSGEWKSSLNVLNVRYCTSCSYKKHFDDLSKHLAVVYPSLMIEGGEYPIEPSKLLLSKLITYLQYALWALIFAGETIFQKLGITPPAIYYKLTKNKVIAAFGVMMIFNNLSASMTNTGAFEVSLNNRLIFSKLQTGKIPDPHEIETILNSYIQI